ncbi:ketosteroid isomerase-like protein [Nocardioides daedukensis]|uniref:Ketosteroid isomerase-like protein n=1 Tax=Nocardioides daedukensis TaxID=634462 RepID=A0A7Y9UW03_9ACTN|nr:ketosteroid isomerase-like protein [Nocardioides daedukensis]
MTAGTETLGCADRAALSDLVHRYAAGVDDRDFDSVAALFTEDGILAAAAPPKHLDPVTEHVGRDGVLEAMQALLAVRGTFHAVAGEVFTILGPDTASGRVACQAHHFFELADESSPRASDLTWTVTYRDSYRRTSQGWRFARREVYVGSVGTRHLEVLR